MAIILIERIVRRALGNIAQKILPADKDESILLSGNGFIAAEELVRGVTSATREAHFAV